MKLAEKGSQAMDANHQRRAQARLGCWENVVKLIEMYQDEAVRAAGDDKFLRAVVARRNVNVLWQDNIPPLVTLSALKEAIAAVRRGEPLVEPWPLSCTVDPLRLWALPGEAAPVPAFPDFEPLPVPRPVPTPGLS